MIEPLHAVPSATKETRSYFDAVAVIVGAVPPLHFTPVKVAVYDPAPVITLSMKLFPAVAVGRVKVQLELSVTVWKVPLVSARVWLVPLLPIATTPSVKFVTVGFVRVLLVMVSVPARVAKSASVTAVLNWAMVPVMPTMEL